jgi:dihydroorotase
MITLKNVKDLNGNVIEHQIQSSNDTVIDGEGRLTIFPAVIDPHVHFRTPGLEEKENWCTAAVSALIGGVTTVFDMPNTIPSTIFLQRIQEKKQLIDKQLLEAKIPLRYGLYLGADREHFSEVNTCSDLAVGYKIFMGSSTGELLIPDDESLKQAFRCAAEAGMVVAVHAEEESRLQERYLRYAGAKEPHMHSVIRDRKAATIALSKAIRLAKTYGVRLYALHLSTLDEINLIREAKAASLDVFAETTPHHLFLDEGDYKRWGTLVQMNPPLRTPEDREALWLAINDGTIDTIGSDHAPHLISEKQKPYPNAPSGVPGLATLLPLLLTAHYEGRLSLERVHELTRKNAQKLFGLEDNTDVVLFDLERKSSVDPMFLGSRCAWSPYTARQLRGWPEYTILQGEVYDCKHLRQVSVAKLEAVMASDLRH